ncbi:MAG: acyltransferase family protein [Vicingaceae bacterium]
MNKPIYFSGLNGIRAIASIIVVIWHTDQFSKLFGLPLLGFHSNGMAGKAVDMFFVLSGFLITYLLFKEKEKINTINLKKFYLRRILRIWPLYYLAIIISIFLVVINVVPNTSNLASSTSLYVFLLANVAYLSNLAISSITPLWSVGVEEQFYLIWPNIIKYSTKYIQVILMFFFGFLLLKLAIYLFLTPDSFLYHFLQITRIDVMAIGAIGAYLVHTKHKVLKLFYSPIIELSSWAVLFISIFYYPIHLSSFIDSELNAIFYLIIILNVSTNSKKIISLENKVFNFLGKISYGLYIYHMIILYSLSSILSYFNIQINHSILFSSILLLTIIVSSLSYSFFEKPFLTIKHKFTVIKSSNTSS